MAIKELFFEGKTLDAAVEAACASLGADKDMLSYELVQTASKGIFGIGSTPAKIKIEQEVPDEPKPALEKKPAPVFEPEKLAKKQPKPARQPKPAPERTEKSPDPIMTKRVLTPLPEGDEIVAALSKFLLGLLEQLGIENGKVDVSLDENGSYFADIAGSKMGILIGRRGETLDATQYLAGLVVNRGLEQKVKVVLDSENYREKRITALEALANKTADKAIKYKRNQALEPMGAYERRIIHAALTDREHISTHSVGTDPRRKVIVTYHD